MQYDLHILAIDDDSTQLELLKLLLEDIEYPRSKVTITTDPEEALDTIANELTDVVITDYFMPERSGLEVLKEVKKINPLINVVVITAFEKTEIAIDVMKNGADDYLLKPVKKDDLEHLLLRINESRTLEKENSHLKEEIIEAFGSSSIIFESPKMVEVLNIAARGAVSKATMLISGESGTGKELVAQLIHHTSKRKEMPFVTLNVAALSENLVESEMFGHKKGSFTGAIADRMGRFEEADQGTLFIDEIGEIPMSIQVKLLRALQEGEIERVGDSNKVKLDVRIIAATNRNLEEMVKNREFRQDLYYRLNVISLPLPPLRDRRVDIPVLADHFIRKFAFQNEKDINGISQDALDKLIKYDYPGNVRELENIVERSLIMCRNSIISLRDLPDLNVSINGSGILNPENLDDFYEEKMKKFESKLIETALLHANGNQSAAARILGITERRLRSRLERVKVPNSL
jgi:DNA-binding NtrC family response regulator